MTGTKYIGMDVHKESISIAVRNASGKLVMECVIEMRITTAGGYGHYFIRTNTTGFRWIAGAVYTWESFTPAEGQPSDSNVEGLLAAAYDSYRFRVGEVHLQANLFPGFSDAGRVRLTTNNELKIKLVKFLF